MPRGYVNRIAQNLCILRRMSLIVYEGAWLVLSLVSIGAYSFAETPLVGFRRGTWK